MLALRRLLPFVSLIVLMAFAPGAEAAFRAKSSLTTKAGATRLVVKLTSTTRLSARTRPRGVSVKAGRRIYKLARVRGTAAAAVRAGTFRTSGYRGSAAARLLALSGKRVSVRVRTLAGTRTLRSRVAPPRAPADPKPVPPGSQPPFAAPGRELQGQEAFNHISPYFVNSRFTDCPGAGWPNCAVEERYMHCAGGGQQGAWEYHRYTPTSGSDINSYGQYGVTGAVVRADGSWVVEYLQQLNGSSNSSFYHWEVGQNLEVRGSYWSPGTHPSNGDAPSQQLGPLRYQQPAGC